MINLFVCPFVTVYNTKNDLLFFSFDIMKVYELVIPSDKGLTNFDLIEYVNKLKIPNFRGIFMRDEMPQNLSLWNVVSWILINLINLDHTGCVMQRIVTVESILILFDKLHR